MQPQQNYNITKTQDAHDRGKSIVAAWRRIADDRRGGRTRRITPQARAARGHLIATRYLTARSPQASSLPCRTDIVDMLIDLMHYADGTYNAEKLLGSAEMTAGNALSVHWAPTPDRRAPLHDRETLIQLMADLLLRATGFDHEDREELVNSVEEHFYNEIEAARIAWVRSVRPHETGRSRTRLSAPQTRIFRQLLERQQMAVEERQEGLSVHLPAGEEVRLTGGDDHGWRAQLLLSPDAEPLPFFSLPACVTALGRATWVLSHYSTCRQLQWEDETGHRSLRATSVGEMLRAGLGAWQIPVEANGDDTGFVIDAPHQEKIRVTTADLTTPTRGHTGWKAVLLDEDGKATTPVYLSPLLDQDPAGSVPQFAGDTLRLLQALDARMWL